MCIKIHVIHRSKSKVKFNVAQGEMLLYYLEKLNTYCFQRLDLLLVLKILIYESNSRLSCGLSNNVYGYRHVNKIMKHHKVNLYRLSKHTFIMQYLRIYLRIFDFLIAYLEKKIEIQCC